MLSAGFSEVDITPKSLGKLGRLIAAPTQVTGIEWPLHARAVVLDDGVTRTAILSVDMNFIFAQNIPEIRETIAAAGGIDPANIMIACTHTHNAYPTTPWHPEDGADFGNLDFFKSLLPGLIEEAIANLAPCRVRVGRGETAGRTYNRRPMYRDESGGVSVGTQGPEDAENFIGCEGPTDDEVKALLFEAEDGRALGGLVNAAGHTTSMFGEPVYSASHVGPLTEALKERYGCVFGYLYALSGNLNNNKLADGSVENTRALGRAIAAACGESLDAGDVIDTLPLRVSRELVSVPQRRVTRRQIEAAWRYRMMDPEQVDMKQLCRDLYGHDFIFYNSSRRFIRVFTDEIIGTFEYQRRTATREIAEDIEVQVLALGDIAVVGFGVELFCEVKHALQSASPFAHTLFASMANGGHGYVPNADSFANGGYETCIGIASQFIPEAASMLQSSALRQLQSLKQ